MVMMNDLDRFHPVMDVVDRVPSLGSRAATLRQQMVDARIAARACTREHGEDDPATTGWTWPRPLRRDPRMTWGAAQEADAEGRRPDRLPRATPRLQESWS